jgi:hypothetical protein
VTFHATVILIWLRAPSSASGVMRNNIAVRACVLAGIGASILLR